MRGHLSLGEVKAEEVSDDTVKAVAKTLSNSTFLKISEDGECSTSLCTTVITQFDSLENVEKKMRKCSLIFQDIV